MLVSVVVPTYNERDTLPGMVRQLGEAASAASIDLEVVIVDDDSPDRTWEVAAGLQEDPPAGVSVRLLHRRGARGLASAVVDGWKISRGEILGVTDADGSHPPANLGRMIRPISEGVADLVVGSRYVPGGSFGEWPPLRIFISRGAGFLARPLTPVRDMVSGYMFFSRHVIDGIRIRPTGYKIGLDVLVRGHHKKVVEVPYHFVDREEGESKMGLRQLAEYLAQLSGLYTFALQHGRKVSYRALPRPHE